LLSTPPQEEVAMMSGSDSSWLPSVGSAGHGTGRCKPCAFLHTVGCENGVACPFCHLCEAGEKRNRRKQKIETRRSARKLRLAHGSSRASASKAGAQLRERCM
jgi:hypothetical protein